MKNFFTNISKEFLKIWLVVDYIVLFILLLAILIGWFKGFDISSMVVILTAWITEIGLSTAAYAWKAKHENCCVNFLKRVISSVPEEYKDQININDIILAIINMPKN